MADGKDPNELGALWLKTNLKGDVYMTGKINDQPVVVFRNRKKEGSNQPDWRVLKPSKDGRSRTPPEPDDEDAGPGNAPDSVDDDIPFY